MDEGFVKVTPDREKSNSILKMVETTLEMIETIDVAKFPSNIVKEYYDVIRELMTAILLLDGYKTHGEGAHKKLIECTCKTIFVDGCEDYVRIGGNKGDYVDVKK